MNKKGCIIAAAIVLALALLGIGGCVYFGMKYGSKFGNAAAALAVESAIEMYRGQNPDEEVPTTNEAWAAKLQDFQMPGAGSNQNMSQFIRNGKLVDIYKHEMKLEKDADGKIRATSAGKDGLMGTEDDVTSELFQKLQEKMESAVPEPTPPKITPSGIDSRTK